MEEIEEYIDKHLGVFKEFSNNMYADRKITRDNQLTEKIFDSHMRLCDAIINSLKGLKQLIKEKKL